MIWLADVTAAHVIDIIYHRNRMKKNEEAMINEEAIIITKSPIHLTIF